MQTENISRFTVHYSAKKVVTASLCYGFLAAIFILVGLFLLFGLLSLGSSYDAKPSIIIPILGMLMLAGFLGWFAIFLVLAHKHDRPVAVIDEDGFEGLRWFRWRRFSWTAQIQLSSRQHGAITLRNVPISPTWRISLREFWQPKECIVVSNAFSLESIQEIEQAIARFNPYQQ